MKIGKKKIPQKSVFRDQLYQYGRISPFFANVASIRGNTLIFCICY